MSALYTAEEITSFAAKQKCTVEEFKKRWIILHNGACHIYGPNGYNAPIKNQLDIVIAIRNWLAPVPPSAKSKAGIDWTIPWGQGEKDKSLEKLITEYGSLATRHVLSTAIEHSYYDDVTETFYERICPLRKLDAIYDEQVDHWMRLLGGKDPETFLDWAATLPDLTRPSCAAYLHAPKDCGKTMLANGASRLWGHMPTPFASAISAFNSAILNCPFVFADEEMPPDVTSGTVRDFISGLQRPIKRKGKDEGSMLGAVRLMLAANNADMLKFSREDFEKEDIAAVGARILYFRCDPEAAAYLQSLGGFEGTADWVQGDRIAKHIHWLAQNRQVKKGTRFLIEGGVDVIHRNLATSGNSRDRAVEWICRAMLENWPAANPGIRFGGGELFVNALFVQQSWTQILGDQRIPSLVRIGKTFRPIAIGERRLSIGPKIRNDQRRADFYRIDPQFVYDNAARLQIGTEEEFRGLIDRALPADDQGSNGSNGGNGATIIPINGHGSFPQNGEIDFFSSEDPLGKSLFDRLPD